MRTTQVGIIGAGPAGLLLSHLLHLEGIESIVLEEKSREYVESRVRAGVLEQATVELLIATGVGERLKREGLIHEGIELLFEGERRRIHFKALVDRCVTVYGQQEVVKDLIAARLAANPDSMVFEADRVRISGFDGNNGCEIRYGESNSIRCDFIAGCDGFHGICRPAIPDHAITTYNRMYPFAWLGILAEAAPASDELIYAHHSQGFALMSMRSPTITRLYLQCEPDEALSEWPDSRIWGELQTRLSSGAGFRLIEGPILQKSVTPMRSFVAEPMQYGRLFLAGDAAHIVPPTGAKGMNLAIADVFFLSRALRDYYFKATESPLLVYSARCLRRTWIAQHFSWWMTSMLHLFGGPDAAFDFRRQMAELRHVAGSRDAAAHLAALYTGLPLE